MQHENMRGEWNFRDREKDDFRIRCGYLEKPRFLIGVAPTSYGINKYDSYVMVFRQEEESLIKEGHWRGREDVGYIVFVTEELVSRLKDVASRIKVGVILNNCGKALIERFEKKFSSRLYREEGSKEYGISIDNIEGLLEDLKECKNDIVLLPNEKTDIFSIADRQGNEVKPEKHEAYILALAAACRMFRFFKNSTPLPKVAPTYESRRY